MEVKRITHNNSPHITTDYMYEGDNIGINLDSLNKAKTKKTIEVPAICIDYSPVSLQNTNNKITITTELKHDNTSTDIYVESSVAYKDNYDYDKYVISDLTFSEDIINTCIINKRDIKYMPCYQNIVDSLIESVKEKALSENMLIKTDILPYKCYVYTTNMELLGVANRLLASNNNNYILGEYVGNKLSEYIGREIFIEMCVNNETTLHFTGFSIDNTIDSSLSYVSLSNENVIVKRLHENYSDTTLKIPNGFNLPNINKSWTIDTYYEKLLLNNSPKAIEEFYKKNKQSAMCNININKYLIW